MKVPYRKDLLHSGIDWKKFFALQAGEGEQKIDTSRCDGKVMKKVRTSKASYKGGRKK